LSDSRIKWIDQLKGFAIILVVYGHNFPLLENYIYSFHMPLFFFLAGIFHPKKINYHHIKKRAKQILIPYFIWAVFLFLFWYFLGRKFGESLDKVNDPIKNFIGIFYAQGDYEFMSWGIPMWFLPSIFVTFVLFGLITRIKKILFQILLLLFCILLGFLLPKIFNSYFFWSLDVALVSLFFYALGFYFKDFYLFLKLKNKTFWFCLIFALHIFFSFIFINKVDMYRAIYGNYIVFLLAAVVGIYFWMFIFKYLINSSFFSFYGKSTIVVLALHGRALTFIKSILYFVFGYTVFNFNELEKIILVFLQLAILYLPIIYINKFLPILNGKIKKV